MTRRNLTAIAHGARGDASRTSHHRVAATLASDRGTVRVELNAAGVVVVHMMPTHGTPKTTRGALTD